MMPDPADDTVIDLDANATTRPLPEVVETVRQHLEVTWGNPGSRHRLGRQARRVLEDSRESIATRLGAHADELIFTSGGTESNNTAIFGLVRGSRGTIALSPGEHPASLEACRHLMQRGFRLMQLPVDREGVLEPEHCPSTPDSAPWSLLAVILAHNETGVIQPASMLHQLISRLGCPVHLDGVQAVGKIPVDFHELGATTLGFGAHKFHGPRGIGGLLVRRGTRLAPLLHGGHQEQQRRAGTEAVPLIAGMAKALELWDERKEQRRVHLTALRDRLEQGLLERHPEAIVNGGRAERLPNTLNIAFPGLDGEALLVALDLAGVACSLGTTCASGSTEPAPILVAMGCPPEVFRASVRFSISTLTTADEIELAVNRVSTVVARMYGR